MRECPEQAVEKTLMSDGIGDFHELEETRAFSIN
jgi:hypothetical protein